VEGQPTARLRSDNHRETSQTWLLRQWGRGWFFLLDQRAKELVALNKDNIEFKSLLSDHYQNNPKDNLFGVLLEHLLVEAHVRRQLSELRMFSNYDRESNTAYLEMGKGRALKITPDSIEVRDNGQDGILFLSTSKSAPWEYKPDAPEHLVYNTLVANANFSEDGQFTVEQQKLLLLLWMVSFAFESMMMFRPIALGVRPGESGKSSLFRYIGRMLIGPKFDVYPVKQDSKGEESFWVAVTNSAFVAWDNVDQLIRWLPDALATVVTGVAQPKREYFTTNKLVEHTPHCMLAVTARTPTMSLRREDVAGRLLPFSMEPLSEKREEFEIHDQIITLRDDLMSDYARIGPEHAGRASENGQGGRQEPAAGGLRPDHYPHWHGYGSSDRGADGRCYQDDSILTEPVRHRRELRGFSPGDMDSRDQTFRGEL
jgi:hypothetical protein